MARPPRTKPSHDDWKSDQWPYTMPMPEAREGGASTWDLWQEESRRADLAFAPTQPSDRLPLSSEDPAQAPIPATLAATHPLSADRLMVVARFNNRVCPQPGPWTLLYQLLEGDRFADLQPPPVQPWAWSKLSSLQKRLRFRDHLEWAERHGCLRQVALFMDGLGEADWLHMGEA